MLLTSDVASCDGNFDPISREGPKAFVQAYRYLVTCLWLLDSDASSKESRVAVRWVAIVAVRYFVYRHIVVGLKGDRNILVGVHVSLV